ncbi:M15 family metallopeptidase [Paenibacillus humicus]|uniref:M15 family metallopeptidase n=1 Tax=Paenibacillus humicus TaxID=412861 RepID=UPI000FD6E2E6|nr:M15 family metallopeptidase [Paenibacillus humicus]
MTLTLDNVRAKSAAKLIGLLPVVAAAASALIERCYNRGVPIVITQGLRTYAEQDALYAQGRTKPGAIVTNARGGYSNHNFGVAIDFALLLPDGNKCSWDTKRDDDRDGVADWNEVVTEAKRLGFTWGGDWRTFTDLPHFEMTFGISTAAYRGGQRPTAAQIAVAYAKINEGVVEMKREDADAVIAYLKTAYGAAKTPAERKEVGRLADVLRVASGQQPQNK